MAAGGSEDMAAPASGPKTGLVIGSGFPSAAAPGLGKPSNDGAPVAEAGEASSQGADRVVVEDRGQQVVAEAAAAAAESVALRQTCAELEQQLRWQRAAAAGALPSRVRSCWALCDSCRHPCRAV